MAKIRSIDDLLTADQETAIQQQARNLYTPSYNASVLSTNQSYENQKAAYETAYDEYEASAEKAKKEAVQTVTDNSVKRGMGRASRTDYDMSEALGEIATQVLAYRKQVDAQLASLTQQKDASLAQLAADYETNILNSAYSLRSQAIQNAQWLAEFNATYGGGGGRNNNPATGPTAEDVFGSTDVVYNTGDNAGLSSISGMSNGYTGVYGGKYLVNGKVVSKDTYQKYSGSQYVGSSARKLAQMK